MAVTRYRVGGAGSWSDTTKWALTTGGAGGESAPGVDDTAIFDSVTSGQCALTADTSVGVLDIANFNHTIDTGIHSLTVKGFSGATDLDISKIIGTHLILDGTISVTSTESITGIREITITASAIVSGIVIMGYDSSIGGTLNIKSGADVTGIIEVGCGRLYNAEKVAVWTIPSVFNGTTVTCTGTVGYFKCGGQDDPTLIVNIYGADEIRRPNGTSGIEGDIRLGAGGCSGTVWFSSIGGSLTQNGNIGTLKIDDADTFTGFTRTSGNVTNLDIVGCSAASTLDINSMRVLTTIAIDGESNLELTGLFRYSGTEANCNIVNTTFTNFNANQSTLPIYAFLSDGNVDGTGNEYVVFVEVMAMPHFSVGADTADLKTTAGTLTLTLVSGVATFSEAQTGNIGIGDKVTYGTGSVAYISSKVSTLAWNLVDELGIAPGNVTGSTVTSIKRCFSTLADALAITGIGDIMGTTDLLANNLQPHVCCYADDDDTVPVICTGYFTKHNRNNIIVVEAPWDTVNECNERQRNTGVAGTGYKLDINDGVDGAVGALVTGTDIAFVNATNTITRTAGDFITAGFAAGMRIMVMNATTAGNNRSFMISTVAASTLYLSTTGRASVVNESAGATVTVCSGEAILFKDVDGDVCGIEIAGDMPTGIRMKGYTQAWPTNIPAPGNSMSIRQCVVHNAGAIGVWFDRHDEGTHTYYKFYVAELYNCVVYGQTHYNAFYDSLYVRAMQTVFYGGKYGLYHTDANFDSFLGYCIFDGHTVADRVNTGEDWHSANRSRYTWPSSGTGSQLNKTLTEIASAIFTNLTPGSENFKVKDSSVNTYRAEARLSDAAINYLQTYSDPDIEGLTLPAVGLSMSIGAFSSGGYPNPYGSIGTRTAFSTGTISLDISGTTVTNSEGAFDANWGKGDILIIGTDAPVMVADNIAGNLILNDPVHAGESGLSFSVSRAYSSITAWEEATDLILVGFGCVYGIIYNDEDYTASSTIIFAGATTNTTCYRILTVAEGHRHLGDITAGVNLSLNAGSHVSNLSTQLQITESYFKLEYLRLHHATTTVDEWGGYAIYCPGSLASKFITINSVLIHDWNATDQNGWDEADHRNLYGIYLYQNGGCKIFNCLITNMHKNNLDSDYGSQAGIIVSSNSTADDDNYLINNTILNITCAANYMKANGGIGIYTNTKTHVFNCLSMVRRYNYDQSSIPNIYTGNLPQAEDYSFDFVGEASDSNNNCGMQEGRGYLSVHTPIGGASLDGVDAFDAVKFPGHCPDTGNGFYGYGFHCKASAPYNKHTDNYIYQAAPGESGKFVITNDITAAGVYTNMRVFNIIAGYKYKDGSTYGNLIELHEDGSLYSVRGTCFAFVNSNPDTITRNDGGSFITDGFIAGQVIHVYGAATAANNKLFTIAAAGVAESTLTLTAGAALTNEVAGASVIITTPHVGDAASATYAGTILYDRTANTFIPEVSSVIVNGDFSAGNTGWATSGNVTFVGGSCQMVTGTLSTIKQTLNDLIIGNTYTLQFTITGGRYAYIELGTTYGGHDLVYVEGTENSGTYSHTFVASTAQVFLMCNSNPNAGDTVWDDLSCISSNCDTELLDILEMVDGRIQFKESYIPDWSAYPLVPTGGSYVEDGSYQPLITGHYYGPAPLCVGQIHNASFQYTITNRVLATDFDAKLKPSGPCTGTGVSIDLLTFPELEFTITGKSRI